MSQIYIVQFIPQACFLTSTKFFPSCKTQSAISVSLVRTWDVADEHLQVRPACFLAELIHCSFMPLVHLSQLSVLSPVIKDFLWWVLVWGVYGINSVLIWTGSLIKKYWTVIMQQLSQKCRINRWTQINNPRAEGNLGSEPVILALVIFCHMLYKHIIIPC